MRQTKSASWQRGSVEVPDAAVFVEIKDGSNFAPLYVQEDIDQTRRVNFDSSEKRARRRRMPTTANLTSWRHLIITASCCPAYRATFAEFLKIDYLASMARPCRVLGRGREGGQLRRLHLMEPAAIGETPIVPW